MNKRILVALVVIALAIIPTTLLLDSDSEATQYNFTASSNGNLGSVTCYRYDLTGVWIAFTSPSSIEEGTQLRVVGTPNSNNSFLNWTVNGTVVSSNSTYEFTMPSQSYSITGNFSGPSHTFNAVPNDSNYGRVDCMREVETGHWVFFEQPENFPAGQMISVQAINKRGYHFVNWTVNGTVVSTQETYSFAMPSSNYTLTCNFAINPSYTFTFQTNDSNYGAVTGYGYLPPDYQTQMIITSPYSAVQGLRYGVIAYPTTGNYFINWTVNGVVVSTDTTYEFTMPGGNYTIVGNFSSTPATYTYTLESNNTDYGQVTAYGYLPPDYQTQVVVTTPYSAVQGLKYGAIAYPRFGYQFVNWTVNGTVVSTDTTYEFTMPGGNYTVVGNFEAIPGYPYMVTYDANGGTGAPATQGPYFSEDPTYTVMCPDTIPTYSGKVFLGWSRTTDVVDEHSGMEIVLYSSEPSITLTAVWYTPEYEGSGTEYRPYTSIKIPVSQMDMLNGKYVSEGADIEIVGDDLGGTYALVNSVTPGYGLTISNGTLTGEISDTRGTVNIKAYTTDGTYSTLWKDVTFTISAVFTLNFDVGDGVGGPGVQIGYSTGVYYDFIISGQVPVMADYDFVGWDSEYTAIHAEYQPGDTYRVSVADDRVGTLYAVWMEHSYVATFWSNGEQNGAVSVLYHMESPARQTYHIIETTNLYKYNEGGTFTLTNNKIEIDAYNVISGGSYYVLISATYYNGDDVIASDTVNIGKWANFIVTVNPLDNVITYTKVNNFSSFQQYGTRETGKVIDLDTGMDSMTVYEIGFGYLNEAPRQQVVATKVFLNTYNVVMKDPTFDIDDYWPNQTNIRFALFSFALYGSTVTFNGYTFTVDKSKITFTYYVDNDKNYIYDPENPPDNIQPVTKSLTLTNLYITWQDGHCYLTFNDANGWTIDMGAYTNREISMEGIWYFQSGMYESYTETETNIVKDWTLLNFDFRVFGLIALGLLVLAGVVMRMMTDAKLGDYLILFGAIGVIITMIGGLL